MIVRISTVLPPPEAPTRPRISPPSNVEGEMVDDDLTAKSHHEIPNPNSKLV